MKANYQTNINSPRSNRKKSSRFSYQVENMNNSKKIEEYSDSSDNCLSFNKKFSIENKIPSLKEKILNEEEELKSKIFNLNLNDKKVNFMNLKKLSLNNQSSSTYDSSLKFTNSIEAESEENSYIIEEKIIKCILIGEKQVGKSLFKNRIIEEECSIQPNCALDIKKKIFNIKNTLIKLEIWDTSAQIQSSPIMQSKLYSFNNII